jgi:uncharacterized protein RhaS with RHS repeats
LASTQGAISYTYGPSGALTAIEYPSGRIVHYDLDGGGLPHEIRLQIDDLPQVALVDNIKYSPPGPTRSVALQQRLDHHS